MVLVPSVTCDRGITTLRPPLLPYPQAWVLHTGCLCVDTTLDRIRPLSQPQTTTSTMHMCHTKPPAWDRPPIGAKVQLGCTSVTMRRSSRVVSQLRPLSFYSRPVLLEFRNCDWVV